MKRKAIVRLLTGDSFEIEWKTNSIILPDEPYQFALQSGAQLYVLGRNIAYILEQKQ